MFIGAVKLTCTPPFPSETARTPPGFPGAPAIIPALGGENSPVPAPDCAATLNWYVVPSCKPVIVAVVFVDLNTCAGCPAVPMYGFTMYAEMAAAPLLAGARQETLAAWSLKGIAVTPRGGPGGAGTVTMMLTDPSPVPLYDSVAVTLKVPAFLAPNVPFAVACVSVIEHLPLVPVATLGATVLKHT